MIRSRCGVPKAARWGLLLALLALAAGAAHADEAAEPPVQQPGAAAADLLADVPDVLALSPTQLSEKLAEVEARRAKVERDARIARTSRREYAAFVDESRRAESADRDRITTTRRGDVVFSPYRTPAVDPPPFPDAFDSPTVVGVGPWGSFVDICLPGF